MMDSSIPGTEQESPTYGSITRQPWKVQYLPSPLVAYLLSAVGSSPELSPVKVSYVVETLPQHVRLLMVATSL
jgi:hypothetical protein